MQITNDEILKRVRNLVGEGLDVEVAVTFTVYDICNPDLPELFSYLFNRTTRLVESDDELQAIQELLK